MRKVILLLILILPTLLFSQKKKSEIYTVSGKILDAITKKPIEDATIIFKDTDSTQIKCGAITNQHGFFSIDVSEGNYYASVEFLSYKSKKLNISSSNTPLKSKKEKKILVTDEETDAFLLETVFNVNIHANK
jgi:hypothetical protein